MLKFFETKISLMQFLHIPRFLICLLMTETDLILAFFYKLKI